VHQVGNYCIVNSWCTVRKTLSRKLVFRNCWFSSHVYKNEKAKNYNCVPQFVNTWCKCVTQTLEISNWQNHSWWGVTVLQAPASLSALYFDRNLWHFWPSSTRIYATRLAAILSVCIQNMGQILLKAIMYEIMPTENFVAVNGRVKR